jgi:hypothetical protein
MWILRVRSLTKKRSLSLNKRGGRTLLRASGLTMMGLHKLHRRSMEIEEIILRLRLLKRKRSPRNRYLYPSKNTLLFKKIRNLTSIMKKREVSGLPLITSISMLVQQ